MLRHLLVTMQVRGLDGARLPLMTARACLSSLSLSHLWSLTVGLSPLVVGLCSRLFALRCCCGAAAGWWRAVAQDFHRWECESWEMQGSGADGAARRLEAIEASFLGSSAFSGSTVGIALVGHRATALVAPSSHAARRCMEKGFLWPLLWFNQGRGHRAPDVPAADVGLPATNVAVPVARLELDLLTGNRSWKDDLVIHAKSLLHLLRPHPSQPLPFGSHTSQVVSLLRTLVGDAQDAWYDAARGPEHVVYLASAQSLLGGWWGVGHGQAQAVDDMLETGPSLESVASVAVKLRQAFEAITNDPSLAFLPAPSEAQGQTASHHTHQTHQDIKGIAAGKPHALVLEPCAPGAAAALAAVAAAGKEARVGHAMQLTTGRRALKAERMQKIGTVSNLIAKSAGQDGEDLREEVDELLAAMRHGDDEEMLARADNVAYCLNSLSESGFIGAEAEQAVTVLQHCLLLSDFAGVEDLGSVEEGQGAEAAWTSAACLEPSAYGAWAGKPLLHLLPGLPAHLVLEELRVLLDKVAAVEEMETGFHLLDAPLHPAPTPHPQPAQSPPPAPGKGISAQTTCLENVAKTPFNALAASMCSTAARQAVLVQGEVASSALSIRERVTRILGAALRQNQETQNKIKTGYLPPDTPLPPPLSIKSLAYLLRMRGRVPRSCGLSPPLALHSKAEAAAGQGGVHVDEFEMRAATPAMTQHSQHALTETDGHAAGDRAARHLMAQDLLILCGEEDAGWEHEEGERAALELDCVSIRRWRPHCVMLCLCPCAVFVCILLFCVHVAVLCACHAARGALPLHVHVAQAGRQFETSV
jgi:hypothetical protein